MPEERLYPELCSNCGKPLPLVASDAEAEALESVPDEIGTASIFPCDRDSFYPHEIGFVVETCEIDLLTCSMACWTELNDVWKGRQW